MHQQVVHFACMRLVIWLLKIRTHKENYLWPGQILIISHSPRRVSGPFVLRDTAPGMRGLGKSP